MLRFVARLRVQTQLTVANRSFAQVFSGQKKMVKKRTGNSEIDNQHQGLTAFFSESDRHGLFRKHSNHLYQFDDETHNITTWNCSKSEQDYAWDQSTANYDNDELIYAFENLLNQSEANDLLLSDPKYDSFIDDFIERLPNLSLNELIRVLQIFVRHPPLNLIRVRQRNYIELFHALDQETTIKSQDLLPKQLLFISSIWLRVPMVKRTYYSQLSSRLFNRYLKSMSAPQLAQALYYINCMSQYIIDIRAFENIFEQKMDELTIEEFSTVLWTFIRLETKLEKQELRNKFFDYLEKQDLSQISDSMLTKILIIISRVQSQTIAKSTKWMNILESLRSNMESRSLKTCILMANVGVSIRLFDKEITLNVFRRCLNHPEELEELSMHDLEYLSRILSMSSYEDREMIQKVGHLLLNEIINRLKYVASRGIYVNFINIIRNLTIIDIYNLELMENIFRPDYIRFIHKSSKQLDLQLYEIDGYNRINLKGIYQGNRLPDIYLEKLCYLVNWIPDRVQRYRKHDEFQYAIEDAAKKLLKYCQFAHAVAHRKHADLFVCLNRNTLEPVDITNNFPPLYQGKHIEATSLTKNDPNLIVLAFVPGHTKEYSKEKRNKCEDIPIGHLAQKSEQLKLLGFQPIVIPMHVFKESSKVSMEQFIIDATNKELRSLGIEDELKPTRNE